MKTMKTNHRRLQGRRRWGITLAMVILAGYASLSITFASDQEFCEIHGTPLNSPNDAAALEGVEVGRILWDVTISDPEFLAGRLAVIKQTYRDLVRQDVTPKMVLAFRGGSVRLLSEDLEFLDEEDREAAKEAQKLLKNLASQPGVRLESCYIAMRRVPLEADHLLSDVHTVGNTFLSAAGYGQKGYVSIPIH